MEFKNIIVGPLETNVYILSSENEGIIIDPGAEADRILAISRGISVRYILLTHNHWDHTNALEKVKNKLDVKCGIHPLDKTLPLFDFEINDRDEIKFGNTVLKVIHTPGHTPGSCSFLVENCLFSGDTVFLGGYGRTDLEGGDETALWKSVEKIMRLAPDILIYPGHGAPTAVKEVEHYPII